MKKNKNLKKLSLNKDAIAKLNNDEMNSLKGGVAAAATYIIPATSSCGCTWGTVVSIVEISIATIAAAAVDCCGTIVIQK